MRATSLLVAALLAIASVDFASASYAEPDLVKLFERNNPAVVVVSAYSSGGTPLSQGSGFIIDPAGTVVTNNHVIGNAPVIVVRRPHADPVFASSVLKLSKEWDLALLKIPGKRLPALKLAQPSAVKVGMKVVAIGSPLGLENTISEGIISGIRGASLLQVTTPISPGSSGGALLSTKGVLVGVTTLTVQGGQSINFAVPASEVAALLKSVELGASTRVLARLASMPDPRSKGASDAPYYEAFRSTLESSCPKIRDVDTVIAQAISVGAPIYNAGSHIGCYRIYEGASYKLLYLLGDSCPTVRMALSAGLAQAETEASGTDKAWTMRRTFDLIVGEPTRYK